MKLFFDARCIRTDFHDGISRYTTELGNALASITPVTFLISSTAQLKFLPEHAEHIVIHSTTSPREPFTAMLLNSYNPDVVISPMQTMGSLGRNFKLILTLHDLIYYKHRTPPHHLPLPIRLGWRLYHLSYLPQRLTLDQADIVATVSETSKQEILAARLTKRPVVVVPNAARNLTEDLKSPLKQSKSAPQNLVYMGAFMHYKNAETLIHAMTFLSGRTLHLLSRITPKRKAELQKLVPADAKVVFHGGVSDVEYAQLLANNAIMVSASKAEGYGLPLAEALKLGVPAVVTDMPIFHEVGGTGALFANPNDPKDFAKKIISLDSLDTRSSLTKAGQAHIEKFQWHTSAQTLVDTAKKLI